MPVEVFYSYSHKDEELRAALETHLAALKRGGWITEWHDRKIGAGSEWQGEIDSHLRSAQLILLLISADFLASDYCYDIELKIALERHDRGEAVVVPIILRPVDWAGTPFARLQALPKDARPVTTWPNIDEAFANVAVGLRSLIQRRDWTPQPAPVPPDLPVPQPRVLDAALPKYVTLGSPAELLAMVRRTDSGGLRAIVQIEDDSGVTPEDVRSRPFTLEFPIDATGRAVPATVTLRIDAPQFEPNFQEKRISVPPTGDSEVCRFLLTPRQGGELAVMLELLIADVYQTARTLRTTAGAAQPAMTSPFGMVSFTLYTMSAPQLAGRAAAVPAGAVRPPAPQPAAPQPHARQGESTGSYSVDDFARSPAPPSPAAQPAPGAPPPAAAASRSFAVILVLIAAAIIALGAIGFVLLRQF